MIDPQEQAARKAAIFAFAGILIAWGMFAFMDVGLSSGIITVSCSVGALACIAAASLLGGGCFRGMTRTTRLKAAATGTFVSLCTLCCGVVVGACFQFAADGMSGRLSNQGLAGYVIPSLLWVLLFGAAPALVLGVAYGLTVRGTTIDSAHRV